MKLPELLCPAGSLEKCKTAILYGANAVYLAGQQFGLRAAADNFTNDELIQAVDFAHGNNAKVHVVLNGFLHDQDLNELQPFIEFCQQIAVDAFIVSDLGVLKTCLEKSTIPIHLSTQASCLSVDSAKLWQDLGASRVILGRECSLQDAAAIKSQTQLEVEMFVHGSMCMAYSGNCVISNYTQGRDSNRGGCAHSCRFEYSFGEDYQRSSFFMSSKDLNGMTLLPQFIESGVDSIKVEGRMKSHLYAGSIARIYRLALDHLKEYQKFQDQFLHIAAQEFQKVSHRAYTNASLIKAADYTSVYSQRESEPLLAEAVGQIIEVRENSYIVVQVKKSFSLGDTLEFIPFKGKVISYEVEEMTTLNHLPVKQTQPGSLVKLPYFSGLAALNLVRKLL